MLRRERGWGYAMEPPVPDLWDMSETSEGVWYGCPKTRRPKRALISLSSFTNMISGLQQLEPPPNFFGGVIADPMGFGKTLAMISLIATDTSCSYTGNVLSNEEVSWLSSASSNLTLVVVPAPSESLHAFFSS
jgi:hypothetical protein